MTPDECITCARQASPHDGLAIPDPMGDLIERLQRADRILKADADEARDRGYDEKWTRLDGKGQGVRLALSYVREYRPGADAEMIADMRRALGLPESVRRIDPSGCGCTDCTTGYSAPYIPGNRHDIPLRYGWVEDARC